MNHYSQYFRNAGVSCNRVLKVHNWRVAAKKILNRDKAFNTWLICILLIAMLASSIFGFFRLIQNTALV